MLYTVSLTEEVFPGFYGTQYDPSEVERYDENGELEEEFTDKQFKEFSDRFCEKVVYLIEQNTNFKIKSWELKSPVYYNYSNDTLWITVDTTPEEILYEFLIHEYRDELLNNIDLSDWAIDEYHEAILREILSFAISDCENELINLMY